MSLFNELQKWLIENPKATATYHKARKIRRENEEKKTEKEIRMEMKEKLSEEEYKKWFNKTTYKKKKADFKRRYKEKKKEKEDEILEILKEVCDELWPGNDTTDWDEYYRLKFQKDDKRRRSYKYYWRASKLSYYKFLKFRLYRKPFRVIRRKALDVMMKTTMKTEHIAYQYLKPYIDQIKDCTITFSKRQKAIDYPNYVSSDPLKTIAESWPLNKWWMYLMFEGMKQNKYMPSEVYLGRISFIFGDVVVTQTWHLLRIALHNNLPWLTKGTVEEIHKKRMAWQTYKVDECPPIYILWHAHLTKISLKWEDLYYIIPG